MKVGLLGCALALVAALVPAAAMADDPRDPTMRSAAAKARDRAIIKRMNQQQLAYVRERDARNRPTYRVADDDRETYANARADYAREMAAWRRAVAACNAGRWEYCDN
ncbi:hypothetical protein [Sphingobium vermicomposti]|uniref:Membrane carboxypeptidase/penicillin-binding protein n=1 Tax=Sphingobium vermicomposti TaxID=529005 RepID=A0A846MBH7_9SPHN|nr:hypothetical protein [Sphingobium vermicomposti]NIJ15145.1 membrane carboxypeptidase/penicillin-binding protein [Sphingobium vermicomposti]